MVDVAVSLTSLTANTRSSDLVGGGTSVTAGQTFSLAVRNRTERILVLLEETNTGAATVTFDAGDEPPSMGAGLGSLDIALAQADLRAVVLEGGRFIQSDGTITGSVATNTVKIFAISLPRTW